MFEPRGFFKSTKEKEYESYMQGVSDVLEALEGDLSEWLTYEKRITLRNKVEHLILEAADDFVD